MKKPINNYKLPDLVLEKKLNKNKYQRHEEIFKIIQICNDIYSKTGNNLDKNVYMECMQIEFSLNGIKYETGLQIPMKYQNQPLRTNYTPDFLCYDEIPVQLFVEEELSKANISNVKNSLNLCGINTGLIINFGNQIKLEYEKFFI